MSIQLQLPDFTSRIKEHVKKHKTAYTIGSYVLVAGVAVYLTRNIYDEETPMQTLIFSPVINNDNSSTVNFGGHSTKIVQRLSDGKTWPKVTEAAEEVGCGVSKMSRHLHGHNPHVYDEVYKIIGIGTTG